MFIHFQVLEEYDQLGYFIAKFEDEQKNLHRKLKSRLISGEDFVHFLEMRLKAENSAWEKAEA